MYCDWPTLGRCCFCMPLRRGVLTFGYLNLIFSAFMVGVYSYAVNTEFGLFAIYHGINVSISIPEGVSVAIYCFEVVFCAILLYGTHMKLIPYIKTYYYFAVTTTLASLLIQIIDFATSMSMNRMGFYMIFEIMPLMFAALAIQVYLIILIRSLLKKMEESGTHAYENQLQQIVYDGKVEANGVYDPTVVPVDI